MATKNDSVVRAPDGFRRVGSVANAPWFALKKGNVLLGVLENVYERPDDRIKLKDGSAGKSKFFQIKLMQACDATVGRAEDRKPVRAEIGQVVNLNYGPKTKELEKFIPDIMRGAEYQVWASCGDKFKISGGRTMWDLDVQVQLVKAPQALDDDEPDFDDGAEEAAAG